MSCRIIGRNVEYAFMNYIIKMLKKRNVSILNAKYIKTRKNALVKNFYDKCSFKPLELSETSRRFTLDLNNYQPNHVNYIRTINEK